MTITPELPYKLKLLRRRVETDTKRCCGILSYTVKLLPADYCSVSVHNRENYKEELVR